MSAEPPSRGDAAWDRGMSDEAVAWAVRSGDPGFGDWDTLTAWLEGDPRRADAYHHAAAAMADAADAMRRVPRSSLPGAAPPRRAPATRRLVAGALAAGVAGLVGWAALAPGGQRYAVETAPGRTRVVALADGSRVALAGNSRVQLDRASPRVAVLDRGQALFTVRHDPARPFRVTAGGRELVDLGTVFDVTVGGAGDGGGGRLMVAVAEGAVRVEPAGILAGLLGGRPLDLGAGQRASLAGAAAAVDRVDARQVGAWTTGQLSFDGRPTEEVAAAVSAALGVPVAAAPGIAARPFTGTLSLDALRRDPGALGPLTGGRMVRAPGGWELGPAS